MLHMLALLLRSPNNFDRPVKQPPKQKQPELKAIAALFSTSPTTGTREANDWEVIPDEKLEIASLFLSEDDYVSLIEQFNFPAMFNFIFSHLLGFEPSTLFEVSDFFVDMLCDGFYAFQSCKQVVRLLANILNDFVQSAGRSYSRYFF